MELGGGMEPPSISGRFDRDGDVSDSEPAELGRRLQQWAGTPGTQAAGPWVRYASNTYDDRSLYAWVGRTGEVVWFCETATGQIVPSTLISGSQTITVEPVLFNVTASTQEFEPGDTVHFAVQTELTATGVTWVFRYTAGGTLSASACSNQLACDVAPGDSGRMEVSLLESATGLYVTARSAEVVQAVVCPPVADSVIDRRDFKARIDTLLAKSILDKKDPTKRQEWAFEVLRDTATGAVRLGPIVYAGTACAISLPVPLIVNGEDVDYVVHSHPHFKGENVRVACGNSKALPFDPRANGGGSNADWDYTTHYGRADYAVSPEWIHKLVPNPDSVGRQINPNRFRRVASGCWQRAR